MDKEPLRISHDDDNDDGAMRWQAAFTDPVYGYVVALALSLGLTPLSPDVRYILLWTLLLAIGALAYLLEGYTFSARTTPGDLVWGVVFGLLIGGPAYVLVAPALALTSAQLFPQMADTAVYIVLVFVLPLNETLLFRGVLYEMHGFQGAALTAGLWSFFLFAPNLNTLTEVVVVGIAMFALGAAYAYVRRRNGFAAAWVCQVIAGGLLLFLPRLGG